MSLGNQFFACVLALSQVRANEGQVGHRSACPFIFAAPATKR